MIFFNKRIEPNLIKKKETLVNQTIKKNLIYEFCITSQIRF